MTAKKKQKSKTSSRKPSKPSEFDVVPELIPRLRIDKVLRYHLGNRPMTKEFVDMIHASVDYLARITLFSISADAQHGFSARNSMLVEYGRKPKTRIDVGALGGLYMEIPKDAQDDVENLKPLIRQLITKIGLHRTMGEIQAIAMIPPKVLDKKE